MLTKEKQQVEDALDEVVIDYVISMIDLFDDATLRELSGGSTSDVDGVVALLFDETKRVLSTESLLDPGMFGGLTATASSVENTLRAASLNYFITSTLPTFEMNWHHIEWGNLVQIFKLLCIVAARDHGKTEVAGTKIVMYDGSIKNVEDIVIGDLLMGKDSTPRKVLRTHTCEDEAYLIEQTNNGGEDYTVNSRHLLHLEKDEIKWVNHCRKKTGKIESININPVDYLKTSKIFKKYSYGVRVNGWDFPEKILPMDPYILGTWLGDGNSNRMGITSIDPEIIESWKRDVGIKKMSKYSYGSIDTKKWNGLLKDMNIHKNKHIPELYFQASRAQRLELLAGLVDTDGNYERKNNRFAFGLKKDTLAKDICRLAWSLGFKSRVRQQKMKLKYKNYEEYIKDDVIITGDIWNIPTRIPRKQAYFRKRNHNILRHRIKVSHVGRDTFYGFTVDGDNLFLHRDGTIIHNSYFMCFAYILWKMFRYHKRKTVGRISKEYELSKEGILVTNEFGLAKHLLNLVKEEIEHNEILAPILMPDKTSEGWGAESIKCKNGATLIAKSFGSKMRGYHPKYMVVDDFLNESSLYSKEQRDKYWNIFVAVIMNMIDPDGQVIVSGTPFHEEDLYTMLKRSGTFKVFEYPAIMPDGSLLWENRHNLESLIEKRKTQGSLIFTREILVKPVSNESSIFPYSILRNAFRGMDEVKLAPNAISYSRKFVRIVIGCDFAISASVGADYSVFTVLGVDELHNFHLLNAWRKKGATYNQQIAVLRKLNSDFKPEIIYAEDNGMQKIFIQMMEDANLPVIASTTGIEKLDLYKGLPSLAVLFEQGKLKFPRGDEKARALTDLYCAELNSITFTDKGKLESVNLHDDTSMSLWKAVLAAKHGTDFDFHIQ